MSITRIYETMLVSVFNSKFILISYFGYVVGCPHGWISNDSMCYHLSKDRQSWIGALQICREIGGQLVEIERPEENVFLKTQAKAKHNNYWIALNDLSQENAWIWMNSKRTLMHTEFTDWYLGQPSNLGNDENCVALYVDVDHSGWRWNDLPCYEYQHYICEKVDQ